MNFVKGKTIHTSIGVAGTFLANIFKHHGLTDRILADHYRKFTSEFWKRLIELSLVKLKI